MNRLAPNQVVSHYNKIPVCRPGHEAHLKPALIEFILNIFPNWSRGSQQWCRDTVLQLEPGQVNDVPHRGADLAVDGKGHFDLPHQPVLILVGLQDLPDDEGVVQRLI